MDRGVKENGWSCLQTSPLAAWAPTIDHRCHGKGGSREKNSSRQPLSSVPAVPLTSSTSRREPASHSVNETARRPQSLVVCNTELYYTLSRIAQSMHFPRIRIPCTPFPLRDLGPSPRPPPQSSHYRRDFRRVILLTTPLYPLCTGAAVLYFSY